ERLDFAYLEVEERFVHVGVDSARFGRLVDEYDRNRWSTVRLRVRLDFDPETMGGRVLPESLGECIGTERVRADLELRDRDRDLCLEEVALDPRRLPFQLL